MAPSRRGAWSPASPARGRAGTCRPRRVPVSVSTRVVAKAGPSCCSAVLRPTNDVSATGRADGATTRSILTVSAVPADCGVQSGGGTQSKDGYLLQDLPLQGLQLRARVEAQLLAQEAAGRSVRAERLALSTAAVQGQHRAAGGTAPATGARSRVRAPARSASSVRFRCSKATSPMFCAARAQLAQTGDLGSGPFLLADVGERFTPPRRQRRPATAAVLAADPVARPLGDELGGGVHEQLETTGVHSRVDRPGVRTRPGSRDQQIVPRIAERSPQIGDDALHGVGRVSRRHARPEPVRQNLRSAPAPVDAEAERSTGHAGSPRRIERAPRAGPPPTAPARRNPHPAA